MADSEESPYPLKGEFPICGDDEVVAAIHELMEQVFYPSRGTRVSVDQWACTWTIWAAAGKGINHRANAVMNWAIESYGVPASFKKLKYVVLKQGSPKGSVCIVFSGGKI